MNIKALGTALKKKTRSAAGAPGRAAYNVTKGRHDKYKMAKQDKEYGFLKDYNAKTKRGVPVTPKERAQFNMFKNR